MNQGLPPGDESAEAAALPPDRGPLSPTQLFFILLLAVFPTMVMLLPGDLARLGGRYAWCTPLAAVVPASLAAWVFGAAAARRGGTVRAALRGWGPWLGRVLLLTQALGLGAYTVVVAREAAEISSVTLVAATVPVWLLACLTMVPAVALAGLGPVVTGRAALIIGPVAVVLYLGILLAMLPSVHAIWALPLLPRNTRFLGGQALGRTWVWLVEPSFLGAVLLEYGGPATRRRAGGLLALAVATSAGLTAAGTWVMVAELGPRGAAAAGLPLLGIVNRVSFGPFVQHVQTATLPVEAMGTALKLAVFLWAWTRVVRGVVGGGSRWILALGATVSLGLGLGLFPNVLALDRALYTWLALWAAPGLMAGLLLIYGAAALRRGGAGA